MKTFRFVEVKTLYTDTKKLMDFFMFYKGSMVFILLEEGVSG